MDVGEVYILITLLKNYQHYPIDITFYPSQSRWLIEENYKTIKYRMELENVNEIWLLPFFLDVVDWELFVNQLRIDQ